LPFEIPIPIPTPTPTSTSSTGTVIVFACLVAYGPCVLRLCSATSEGRSIEKASLGRAGGLSIACIFQRLQLG
jgi:hypothetical protein